MRKTFIYASGIWSLLLIFLNFSIQAQTPTVSINGSLSVCAGTPIALTVNCPATYNKVSYATLLKGVDAIVIPAPSVNYGTFSYVASTTGVGVFTWKLTNDPGVYTFNPGCVNTKSTSSRITGSVAVTVIALPSLKIASPASCTGQLRSLTAVGCSGGALKWSTGQTSPIISVSTGNSTSTYSATCTLASSCVKSTTAAITLLPPVSVTLTPQSLTLCEGQTAVLSAISTDNIAKYKWSTGATSSTILVSKTDTYAVTVSNAAGCQATASTRVVAQPRLTINASASVVCAGQKVQLTTTGCDASKTFWSTGAIGNSITVQPTQATVYSVSCVGAVCTPVSTTSVTVKVNAGQMNLPTIAGSQTVCLGGVISLTATCPQGVAAWAGGSENGVLFAAASRIGTYSYQVACPVVVSECGNSMTTVTVTVIPKPTLTASDNRTVCVGTPLTLTASCTSGTLVWNNTMTTNAISVYTNTTGVQSFTVSCRNSLGCTVSLVRQVVVGQALSFSLVNTTLYPAPTSVILMNLPDKFTYWAPILPAPVALVGSVCGSGGDFSYTIAKIVPAIAPFVPGVTPVEFVYVQKGTTLSVPGSTTASIPRLEAGTYIATIQTPLGTRTIVFTINQALEGRIASNSAEGQDLAVIVSPNPVMDEVLIQVNGVAGQHVQLQLTDTQGRQLHEHSQENAPTGYTYKIRMKDRPAGIYLIGVTTPTQRTTVRILKID